LTGETDPQSGPEVEEMYGCSPDWLIKTCMARQTPINTVNVQQDEWIYSSLHSVNTALNKPQRATWYSPRFSITEFEAHQSTVPEKQQFDHQDVS